MDSDEEETNWFSKFGSSKWWFGKNSMFAQALETAGASGFEFKGIKFQHQANVGLSNDEYIKIGIAFGFVWLLTRN